MSNTRDQKNALPIYFCRFCNLQDSNHNQGRRRRSCTAVCFFPMTRLSFGEFEKNSTKQLYAQGKVKEFFFYSVLLTNNEKSLRVREQPRKKRVGEQSGSIAVYINHWQDSTFLTIFKTISSYTNVYRT
jgi:hypothetical protein